MQKKNSQKTVLNESSEETKYLTCTLSQDERKKLKHLGKITTIQISRRSKDGNKKAMKALKSMINTIRK